MPDQPTYSSDPFEIGAWVCVLVALVQSLYADVSAELNMTPGDLERFKQGYLERQLEWLALAHPAGEIRDRLEVQTRDALDRFFAGVPTFGGTPRGDRHLQLITNGRDPA